ncbi:motile sperm domain-containing protein 2 [Fundulus heteroclitus]|uniref:motile sperm domain-containing protein 2 n=1 Tax=Fundulus heteroclitus TaxID=8078 RepID=UPI00165C0921|nr:motile sperm domain-containing protein 2 [Fundulus heteroclitus]
MAEQEPQQDLEKKIEETRQRFKNELLQDSTEKYDSRDVGRLEQDDALVEAYLTWRLYVVDDALKMIDESLLWRKEFGINDVSESTVPRWMFESGAVYLHGYDKEGNKLFWFKVKLHVKDAKSVVDKKKYIAFWLERYAKKEPGMPLTVVFDMTDSGISNIDMDFVKYVVNCFKVYYPKFLSKMIIVDMPWIMNAAWRIVKSWLGPEAIAKLKFASKAEVQTFIDPEYLPPHLGGTDPFKYNYPPLPDDDFQTPLCENGPIVSEDDAESKEGEMESRDTLESSYNSEIVAKPKKVNFLEDSLRSDDGERDTSAKAKGVRKPQTTFKGLLLDVSPAEELSFGSGENEKKCLIVLSNVAKNQVAFKVRTTAPEKYRVKPSSSSCEPGASVDIVVSLHGGSQASPQDRFLIMAAEMENVGSQELAQFWKEVPKTKITEHRLRCHILDSVKPAASPRRDSLQETSSNGQQELSTALMRVMACNSRLEQKVNSCLWVQKVLTGLVLVLLVLNLQCLYLLGTAQRPS